MAWMLLAWLACSGQPGEQAATSGPALTGEAYHQAVREVLSSTAGELMSLDCYPEPCVAVLKMPPLKEDGGASRKTVKTAVRDAGFTLAIPVLFREYEGGEALLSVVPAGAKAEGDDKARLETRMREMQNDVLAGKRVTVDASAKAE